MRIGVGVGAASALTLSLLAVSPANAHDVLVRTTPAASTTVARVPDVVTLVFGEPAVAIGTAVIVTGPAGAVQVGAPNLVGTSVQQPLSAGSPAGSYTVRWRVTSADGHPVSGGFTFVATRASNATPATHAPAAPVIRASSLPSPAASSTSGGGTSDRSALVLAGLAGAIAGVVVVLVRRRRRPSDGSSPDQR